MKKIIFTIFCLASFNLLATEIDVAKSSFKWIGKKVTGQHYGKIKLKSGDIELKKGSILKANLVMDMQSITVDDITGEWEQKFISHMHSPDFFNTNTYPTATLKITKVEGKKLIGQLTILDQTNKIEIFYEEEDGAYKGVMTFDRTKFGIKYKSGNFFKSLGDKMIYDDVTLEFRVVTK